MFVSQEPKYTYTELGVSLDQLLHDRDVSRIRVFLQHVLESTPRAQSHTSSLLAKDVDDGVQDSEQELAPALPITSIVVGSLVGDGFQELIDEVAVGAVKLDTVESSLQSVLGSLSVGLDEVVDVLGSHLSGNGVVLETDGRRRNGLNAFVLTGVGSTESPSLKVDISTLGVDSVGDLLPGSDLLFGVDTGRSGVASSCRGKKLNIGDSSAFHIYLPSEETKVASLIKRPLGDARCW